MRKAVHDHIYQPYILFLYSNGTYLVAAPKGYSSHSKKRDKHAMKNRFEDIHQEAMTRLNRLINLDFNFITNRRGTERWTSTSPIAGS